MQFFNFDANRRASLCVCVCAPKQIAFVGRGGGGGERAHACASYRITLRAARSNGCGRRRARQVRWPAQLAGLPTNGFKAEEEARRIEEEKEREREREVN